jgi:hypothetical protein
MPFTDALLPISFANLEARPHLSFLVGWIRHPNAPDRITAITWRVTIVFYSELADVEARSVRWRSGFYEVQHSRKEVIDILGEPNLPADDAVTGHNRDGTYGLDP